MLTFELPEATTSPHEICEPTIAAGFPLTKTELAPELTLPPWGSCLGRAWGTIPEPTNAIAVPLTKTLDDPELSTVGGAEHAPAVLLPITAAPAILNIPF